MQINLINPMWDASGGAEWRTLELYRHLKRHARVRIWSEYEPDPRLCALVPIRRIRPQRPWGMPKRGVAVVVGAYHRFGSWWQLARPSRIILIYNTDTPDLYRERMAQLSKGGQHIETVFASMWLRQSVNGTGEVLASLIDLTRFSPSPKQATGPARDFTIGRLSRDVSCKHNPRDVEIYRALAQSGVKVRIMGGTCLASELAETPRIEILPAGAEDAATFLRSLDCFFYRTHPAYREPHGRVVQEAMACGLPVVTDSHGGYAEYIRHGQTGFLAHHDTEVLELIRRLRDDAELRRQIATASRAAMEDLFSPQRQTELIQYFVRK